MPFWAYIYCLVFVVLGYHGLRIRTNVTQVDVWFRYLYFLFGVSIFLFNYGLITKPNHSGYIYSMVACICYSIVSEVIKEWPNAKKQFESGVQASGYDNNFRANWDDLKYSASIFLTLTMILTIYYAPLIYVSYSLIKSYH